MARVVILIVMFLKEGQKYSIIVDHANMVLISMESERSNSAYHYLDKHGKQKKHSACVRRKSMHGCNWIKGIGPNEDE